MIDFVQIAKSAIQYIGDEWEAQGHNMTGAFRQDMRYEIERGTDSVKIRVYDGTERGYGKILDDGVPADRIPFTPGVSRAKRSKYIQGLIGYAKQRMGAADKDAISIAFAIAHKHAQEGMPTKASERFSRTGARTRFVEAVSDRIKEMVKKEINESIKNGNYVNNNA